MRSIAELSRFRDQQYFSSTSLEQADANGRDWRKRTVENYNEASNLLLVMEERLEQQEKYIERLEKMNDSLLAHTRSTIQELA